MSVNRGYKHIYSGLLICASVALISFGAFAQDNSIQDNKELTVTSLNDALSQAYLHNPILRAAREEMKSTVELLPQALSGWRPTISSELSVISTDTKSGGNSNDSNVTTKDIELSLNQPLFRGGRTLSETKAAKNTIKAQASILRAGEQDVLLDAAIAYMDVLRDAAFVELSENNRDVIALQAEATKKRFDVGVLTRTDVSQSEARLADAQANVITTVGDLRSSQAVLENLIGFEAEALEKPNNISLNLPTSLNAAIAIADTRSPDIMMSKYIHLASEEAIGSVFAELLPSVALVSSWSKTYDPVFGAIGATDDRESQVIGVTASIPLYSAGGTRSRVRQAKYDANKRYIETLQARRKVKQDVIQSWQSWQTSRAEIESRKVQVEASLIAQEGVKQEEDLGARTILDSLNADQELLDAQVSLVRAQRDEIVARFALAAELGFLTPETLGFSGDLPDFDERIEDISNAIFSTTVDRVVDGL